MTGPTSGRTPAQTRPDAALGVEAARPLALPDDRGTLDEGRDRLDRRHGDEGRTRRHATPLEVEDERPRIGGQDEQPDRGRDREQPEDGLGREVDALDGRVERPDLEDHGRACPGEDAHQDHRHRRSAGSAGTRHGPAGRSTPARHASTSMIATMTIGPT